MRLPVEELLERYKNSLFAASFNICKSACDAEDVLQETFLKYYASNKQFDNEEHIKAWLLRVAINKSKNITLSFWNRNKVEYEEYVQTLPFETKEESDLFHEVMELPSKYRIVIHLYYNDDYSISEIGKMLSVSKNTVKTRLRRGRMLLKERLKEDWDNE